MKPIAWYDPTNGMVSTDKDSSLFTPLGQVWPLYPPRTWVGLTDEEVMAIAFNFDVPSLVVRTVEAKLEEKNT